MKVRGNVFTVGSRPTGGVSPAEFAQLQTDVAQDGVIRTVTTNELANTLIVTPIGIPAGGLRDNMIFEVRFVSENSAPMMIKVGTSELYPLTDAYGGALPRKAVAANELAQIAYKSAPSPHFRLYKHAFKSGIMQLFPSRSALEAAAVAGATLPDDGVFVAGFSNAGDGGHCLMSRQSQVFRSPAGFGVVVSADVGNRAFGTSLGNNLENPSPAPEMADWKKDSLRTRDDVLVDLAASGLSLLAGADYERVHVVPFASAANRAEIDASTIPRNRVYRIVSRGPTGAQFVIDAGAGRTWAQEGGGRYLVCGAGVAVSFVKDTLSRLFVVSVHGGAVASTNDYTRTVRGQSVLIAGQSILAQAFGRGSGAGSFVSRYAELYSGTTTNFINIASGGSGICERDGASGNYWVDMRNPDAPADGPLLIAAAATIATRDGDMGQPQISAILWDQGQTCADVVDAIDRVNASFTREMYVRASVYALERLLAMIGSSVPIIFQRLGRSKQPVASKWGWQVIREAQRDIVSAVPSARLGPETWDYQYKDKLHPDDFAQYNMGIRLAEALAIARGRSGLTTEIDITAAAYNRDGRYITVTLNAGPYRFQDPAGFTVFDAASTIVPIARIHWVSTTTLRLFLTADAFGGTLYYGWGIVEISDDKMIPRRGLAETAVTLGQPIRPSRYVL